MFFSSNCKSCCVLNIILIWANFQVGFGVKVSFNVFSNLSSTYFEYLDNVFNQIALLNSNISRECQKDTYRLLQQAEASDLSALKMLDSSGKPSSGVLNGGAHFLGFFSECVGKQFPLDNGDPLEGKYCLLQFNFSTISPTHVIPQASWVAVSSSQKPPTVGLCVPSSCSEEDIQKAHQPIESVGFTLLGNPVCQGRERKLTNDPSATAVLCFFVILLILVVFSTGYDYANEYWMPSFAPTIESIKSVSQSVEELVNTDGVGTKKESFLHQFLLGFSFRSNVQKIFSLKKSEGGISALHGLRFYSMVLIILGHTYSFATQYLYFRNPNEASQAPKDFFSQFFANGTLAVDTFYFISGLLVSYVTLKVMEKTNGKLPVLYFYFHRYFRLTPLFGGVILFCAYLLQYMGSGPNWLLSISMYDTWCRWNGWINILYLHNFINTKNMCLSHTWYLATDMQMYLVVPFILIPLHRNRKYGFIVLSAFMLATIITTAVLTAVNHFPAIPYQNNILPLWLVNEYYTQVYIKPYTRIGPYLVGIAAGYFFIHIKELQLKKSVVCFLWAATIAEGLSVIYLMWPANQGRIPNDAEAASYSALARSAWALGLTWLTIACHYGYAGFINNILSWRHLVPFSRLTYAAYLIHPVVMCAYYGTFQDQVDFTLATLMYMFLGNLCITYFLSVLLSATLESPFVAIEKIMLKKKSS